MRISFGTLGINNIAASAFGGRKTYTTTPLKTEDTFTKREDKYTKTYKALVLKAYSTEKSKRPYEITVADIRFLLDIRDYNKFKNILSTPVTIKTPSKEFKTNILFYTNPCATVQIAKRLNENGDKEVFKRLLSQKTGDDEDTVLHNVARKDYVAKATAIRESLSLKEFKNFINAKNKYRESAYSIAEKKNGELIGYLEPFFEND